MTDTTEKDAGLPRAVDRASAVFGWQHLVRYSGMSPEWMDKTLTAIVRAARVTECDHLYPPANSDGTCPSCGKPRVIPPGSGDHA